MEGFNFTFDARTVAPRQSAGGHPVGKYLFTITDTKVVPTAKNDGGMLVLTLTSDEGSIDKRYNLWNQSEQARQIAQGELSALCHAVGIYDIKTPTATELRNGRGLMEIVYQAQSEEDKKAGKIPFVEVKKIFDVNGNEPGKAPANNNPSNAPSGVPSGVPMTNTPANAGPTAPWGNGQQQTQQPREQPQQTQQVQQQPQWAQNNGGGQSAAPPWAKNG